MAIHFLSGPVMLTEITYGSDAGPPINTVAQRVIKEKDTGLSRCPKLGYKDSNLEMTESESVALPFGDTPIFCFRGTCLL